MIEKALGLTGSETIKIRDRDETILDFWRWAFSDLKSNSLRGVFAEWLVARLLSINAPVRDSWAECDLHLGDIGIEVKASAYLQTWRQKKPSRIVFSGLCGRKDDFETGYADKPTYNADIYVFCVQIEQDPEKWDALDLDQWRFYILTKEQVERTGCKSLGLSAIKQTTDELTADEFRKSALAIVGLIGMPVIGESGGR